MTAPLEVHGLAKTFGRVKALDGVDMEVLDGEILGIIGPNGSGKTTLFNCVSGRTRPTAGRVVWQGQEITGKAMHAVARLGLVRTFQEARAFVTGTVRTNLEIALAVSSAGRGSAKDDAVTALQDVDALLRLAKLEEATEMPASALPFGVLRKLGVAMALAARPKVLMLDEPAAGLNAAEGAELGAVITAIRDAGVTLVIVDHDMDFLLPLTERVVALANGTKIAEGPPDMVRRDPRVIEVYLGSMSQSTRTLAESGGG